MDDAERAVALADSIRPLLAGHAREIQGAALADLVSMWLAGHFMNGEAVMETILNGHVAAVRTLLPAQVEALKEKLKILGLAAWN